VHFFFRGLARISPRGASAIFRALGPLRARANPRSLCGRVESR